MANAPRSGAHRGAKKSVAGACSAILRQSTGLPIDCDPTKSCRFGEYNRRGAGQCATQIRICGACKHAAKCTPVGAKKSVAGSMQCNIAASSQQAD